MITSLFYKAYTGELKKNEMITFLREVIIPTTGILLPVGIRIHNYKDFIAGFKQGAKKRISGADSFFKISIICL